MTDSPDAPLGTLRRDGEHGTVRIGVLIDATASAVWQALTEPDRLADRLGQNSELHPGYQALPVLRE